MENHWYSQIIGSLRDAPFINRLAGRGNLETSYYGVTHPSMFPKCGYPDSGLDHGAIQLGDRFLRGTVGMITHSRLWQTTDSSIIITLG